MVDAVIKRQSRTSREISLSVSGEVMDSDNTDLSHLQPPLSDYQLSASATLNENELLISQLRAQIGSSQAGGKISIRYQEPHYDFDIDLTSPFLETDDLVKWTQDWRDQRRESAVDTRDDSDRDVEPIGVLGLITQFIDEFTGTNRFKANLGIDELRASGRLLGKAELTLKLDENELLLDPLRITSPLSETVARYRGSEVASGFETTVDVKIEKLQYGGLLRLFNPDTKARGELFLDTSLVSRSPTADQTIEHLEGNFDVAVFPKDSRAEFLDLWTSNLIFALLPVTTGKEKSLNCLVARFDVENGVMKSKNTFLDSTETIVRARGNIDFANRELDLWIAPQAKLEKFLSISTPIEVSGPFEDFNVGVAPGGFVTTMFRWYLNLIYVPWKWLTGESFPADGIATCRKAMGWDMLENPE